MTRLRSLAVSAQKIWAIAGLAFLLLLVLDSALQSFLVWREHGVFRAYMREYPDPDRSWVPAYTEEFLDHDSVAWRPYVYWRRVPYEGQYFRVDQRGLRETWNASHTEKDKPIRIFMFGGSTMWGTGVRADHTLPSALARVLEQGGTPVQVINYGEGGYVATQELITLLMELRRGNVPDLVIFYDGVNEVFTSYANGVAGFTSNEDHRAAEFNGDEKRSRLEKAAAFFPGLRHFAQGLGSRLAPAYSIPPAKVEALEDDTVRVYRENVRVVDMLAREYGFRALFYWQPAIFNKDHLAPNEVKAEASVRYIRAFNVGVYQRLKLDRSLNARSNFHDISEIFRHVDTGVFADFCHLSEHGNEMVAEHIGQDVKSIVRQ